MTLNYEAGKVNLTIAWKCFDVVNGNASTLASRLLQCGIDCRDRCVQQGYTGSHDEKKNDFRIQVCFCSYGLSGLKNDSSCTWCSIKWSLVSHNSNFHAFFSLRFPQYLGSWNRLISTWRNFGCPMGQLFAKALGLPVLHALTVWYNFLLRWSWNCQNTRHGFYHFFSHWKDALSLLKSLNKKWGSPYFFCSRAAESVHHLHPLRFLN